MANWIADVVGKMHVHKITQTELANKLGIRREQLNRILNSSGTPANAEERILKALDELIKEKSEVRG